MRTLFSFYNKLSTVSVKYSNFAEELDRLRKIALHQKSRACRQFKSTRIP